MASEQNNRENPTRAEVSAETFIRFAKERGLDVRFSDDKTRVELYSSSNGRKLCSSPVEDFSTERP